MFLLKDTTQWCRWGSNLRPLGFKSSTLPLSPPGLLFEWSLKTGFTVHSVLDVMLLLVFYASSLWCPGLVCDCSISLSYSLGFLLTWAAARFSASSFLLVVGKKTILSMVCINSSWTTHFINRAWNNFWSDNTSEIANILYSAGPLKYTPHYNTHLHKTWSFCGSKLCLPCFCFVFWCFTSQSKKFHSCCLFVCLFVLLLYVPSQQLWSWPLDLQSNSHLLPATLPTSLPGPVSFMLVMISCLPGLN